MARTILTLPDTLLLRLKALASERGISMAELIRDALEESLSKEQPMPKAVGMFDLGDPDLASSAGEIEFEPASWR
jgi:metal-responsive CopG/Arc/MetJ family transcriptional regulator